MLHTKFLGNLPSGSGEDFERFGHGSNLGHVTSIVLIHFISNYLKAYIQIWLKWPSGFRAKQILIFKCKWP